MIAGLPRSERLPIPGGSKSRSVNGGGVSGSFFAGAETAEEVVAVSAGLSSTGAGAPFPTIFFVDPGIRKVPDLITSATLEFGASDEEGDVVEAAGAGFVAGIPAGSLSSVSASSSLSSSRSVFDMMVSRALPRGNELVLLSLSESVFGGKGFQSEVDCETTEEDGAGLEEPEI